MINRRQIIISLLITIFLFSFAIFSYAEEQAAPQALTIQQLKEDTDFFFKTIEDTHPNLYYKLSKEDYDNYKKLCYSKINKSMPVEEYSKILAGFLNKVGDGHTRIGRIQEKIKTKDLSAPFLTEFIDGKILITKVFSSPQNKIKKGDIILYINNISAKDYLLSKIKYMSYNDLDWALIRTAQRIPFLLSEEKDQKLTISSIDGKVFDCKVPLYDINDNFTFKKYYYKPYSFHGYAKFFDENDFFKCKYFPELNMGYLEIKTFLDRQVYKGLTYERKVQPDMKTEAVLPDFSEFLEKNFKMLNSKKFKCLVIDLRKNSGGDTTLGDQLLRYFTSESMFKNGYDLKIRNSALFKKSWSSEFYSFIANNYPEGSLVDQEAAHKEFEKHKKSTKQNKNISNEPEFYKYPKIGKLFKGKVVILIGPYVFSSAEDFSVACKDNGIGICVGEPTGGGVTVPGEVLSFSLVNSKLKIDVSSKMFVRQDKSRINERAVYPDYYVYQTIEDFRAGKDTVLEFVKQGIKENKF